MACIVVVRVLLQHRLVGLHCFLVLGEAKAGIAKIVARIQGDLATVDPLESCGGLAITA